jgi:hypothetical protein
VRAQVDRDLTTVDYFDRLLGLIKNLGPHISEHESSRNNEGEIVTLKDPDRIQQKGRPKKPKRLKSMVEQEREKMRKGEEKKKNKKPTNASASKYRFIEHSSSLKRELQKK